MQTNIDYLDSLNWEEDAMLERLGWLREHDPVHWSEECNLFVVTKFEDVAYISKHHKLFCSGQGIRPGNEAKIGMIDEDDPRHGSLRGLINKGFTPRMVAMLEPVLLDIVTESIDAVASRGECDFTLDIAVPIPLLIIAEMIGIRREDREKFHHWSDDLMAADGNYHRPEVMHKATEAFLEYSAYVTEIIEDRRRSPKDDLMSILVGAKDEGVLGSAGRELAGIAESEEHARLANDELIQMLVLLMVAGNETTRNALSGGMALLIENPAERQKLIDDPSLIPSAVEEMLRLVSPVRQFARTATEDTALRGTPIKKGQKVLMMYPSANRDPEVFDDPDAFRAERNPDHLAFGIGNHFCLGANLARLEMCVTFRELLRRLPDMQYAADGPVLVPAALVRNCASMPVRFTPERHAETG